MTLETAKKLAWPWKTRDSYFAYKDDIRLSSESGLLPARLLRESVPYPSVEEMLERMPIGCKIVKVSRDKYMAVCPEYQDIYHSDFANEPSEALALLAIWLRDNGLMEWKEEKWARK